MRRRQAGLSLIELVFTIVVLGVGLVALLIPISNSVLKSGDPLANKQMVAIAEAMLEEIELKPFGPGTFAGPYTPANRASFDAVFPDYNNYTTGGAGIADITGAAVPGLGAYNLTVTLTPTALGAIPAANVYLITVQVTGPNGTSISLSGVRSSYF